MQKAESAAKPSEQQIHDKLFKEVLPSLYPDSVIVKNWMGWSYRGAGDKKEQNRFRREFDLAVFQRKTVGTTYQLTLTGYEVKGYSQKPTRPPAFAEGLDQAIVLLQQGADYIFLVHPDPENDGDKYALRDLCARYAPMVGVIFIPHDLSKLTFLLKHKEAQQNPHTTPDIKRKMLTAIISGGMRDDISSIPSWCKTQQY
jgi:hypothetical protein